MRGLLLALLVVCAGLAPAQSLLLARGLQRWPAGAAVRQLGQSPARSANELIIDTELAEVGPRDPPPSQTQTLGSAVMRAISRVSGSAVAAIRLLTGGGAAVATAARRRVGLMRVPKRPRLDGLSELRNGLLDATVGHLLGAVVGAFASRAAEVAAVQAMVLELAEREASVSNALGSDLRSWPPTSSSFISAALPGRSRLEVHLAYVLTGSRGRATVRARASICPPGALVLEEASVLFPGGCRVALDTRLRAGGEPRPIDV